MAIPTQGGLGQASAQAKPPTPAATKFDVDAAQAENLETEAKSTAKTPALDDLGGQREAMNEILMRLRAGLDTRKNRMFDPVLMQAAAGFLKPTKTGSFGESLGYAAEGAGAASEREMVQDRENQKMEMELAAKEMEFRQQLGGDAFVKNLLGKQQGVPSATAAPTTAPAAGPSGAPSAAPQAAAPMNAPAPESVLTAARQGRIPVTDEILLVAQQRYPKMFPALKEMRLAQEAEEKNRIEREKLEFQKTSEKRKVIPRGLRTEREITAPEYNEYQAALKTYLATGDEGKLLNFYDSKGWLEAEQVRGRKVAKPGEAAEGIKPAKSAAELAAEEEALKKTAGKRAESAESLATKLGLQAEAAFENTNIANDMIGYAKNNPAVFEIMNKPGLANAVARAVEQGASVGNFNVSLPASVVGQYKLTGEDLTALQMFMQKNAQLQSRGRQLNRTPGEGAISDFETRLLGGIYALPSDSQRAILLKSDALKMQGMFDEERFKLWNQKSKRPGYSYNDFLVDDDYKAIKKDYLGLLDRVREENLDLLSPKRKDKAPASAAKPAPAPSDAFGNSEIPKAETPLQRFKREQAERNKGKP